MKDIINKFVGMDEGTRKDTIAAFIVAVLDFLTAFNIIHFDELQIQAIYKLLLVIVTAIVWGYCSHYKNNNFTEEGCIGTGITRQLKKEKEENYIGDVFFTQENESYETAGIECTDEDLDPTSVKKEGNKDE